VWWSYLWYLNIHLNLNMNLRKNSALMPARKFMFKFRCMFK